jgi:hypothetical protein
METSKTLANFLAIPLLIPLLPLSISEMWVGKTPITLANLPCDNLRLVLYIFRLSEGLVIALIFLNQSEVSAIILSSLFVFLFFTIFKSLPYSFFKRVSILLG